MTVNAEQGALEWIPLWQAAEIAKVPEFMVLDASITDSVDVRAAANGQVMVRRASLDEWLDYEGKGGLLDILFHRLLALCHRGGL